MSRVSDHAQPAPGIRPAVARARPCLRTSRATCDRITPRAMRSPISRVRCLTVSLIGNSALYRVITSNRYQVGVAECRAFDNHQRIGYEITSSDYEFVSQPCDG